MRPAAAHACSWEAPERGERPWRVTAFVTRSPSSGWAVRPSASIGTRRRRSARRRHRRGAPHLASISKDQIDAYWLGTMGSGVSGLTLSPPAEDRLQAGHPGGEHVRHRLRSVPQRLLRRGVGRLRHGDGRAASRSSRTPGSPASVVASPPTDGTERQHHRAGHVQPARARVRQQVRRRRRRDEGRAHPHRVEEPPQRCAQPPGAVQEGGLARRSSATSPLIAGTARHLRLLGRVRRRGARAIVVRAEDAYKYTDKPLFVKALSFVAGPGGRSDRPRVRLHDLHRGGRVRRGRLQPGRGHRSPRPRSRWPRCTTASRPPSWCSWRISGSPSVARRGRRCSRAPSTSTVSCRSTPTVA